MTALLQFEDREIPVFHGETIASALRKHGFPLSMECGGKNLCGKCRIKLLAGSFVYDGKILNGSENDPPHVNACSLKMISSRGKAVFASSANGIYITGTDSTEDADSIAIDLGTTNVSAALVSGGKILKNAETVNRQVSSGDNVIGRIAFSSSADGEKILRRQLIDETIEPMLKKLTDHPEKIKHIIIAGNTVMTHFFFGRDPAPLGKYPFEPLIKNFTGNAGELGLTALLPETPVYAAEYIAGFIGGDISAGLQVSGFGSPEKCELYIDTGTNCEMILNVRGSIYALSAAAGPAFERGAFRADAPGCIRHVKFRNGKWQFSPAGKTYSGFCGSALIDLLSELYRYGFIDDLGRYKKETGLPENLLLPEEFIAELITAKAAISSGLTILLKHAGISASDIRKVSLAGNFSLHTDIDNAVYTGILPDIPRNCFEKIGNASLDGAVMLAGDPALIGKTAAWRSRIIHINPAEEPDYMKYFTSAMSMKRGG